MLPAVAGDKSAHALMLPDSTAGARRWCPPDWQAAGRACAEDILGAQVVAPVRETAAQALGAAARGLPASSLHVLVRHLTTLVAQAEWGVRLAGLLGIKYVLAARLDQAGALLPAVLPSVLTGLKVNDHAESSYPHPFETHAPPGRQYLEAFLCGCQVYGEAAARSVMKV